VSALQDEMFQVEPVQPEKVTERNMLDALHRRYGFIKFGARRWAVAEHVPNKPYGPSRIADFIAMDTWSSGGFELIGHEVKVSRSDWLTELRDPWKAAEFTPYMHRWWVVVPCDGIVRLPELPERWGLMVLRPRGLRAERKAPKCAATPLTPERLAALLRAVQKTAATRGLEPS
jgi:hypothetical protein